MRSPVATVLCLLLLGGAAACEDTGTGRPAPTATIDKGVGSQDASADVKIAGCADSGYGLATGKITIVNHSSKRSDYVVDVVFVAADGTHVGTGVAFTQAIEPKQRAVVNLTGSTSGKWTKCKIVKVQRTASG